MWPRWFRHASCAPRCTPHLSLAAKGKGKVAPASEKPRAAGAEGPRGCREGAGEQAGGPLTSSLRPTGVHLPNLSQLKLNDSRLGSVR